MWAVVIKENMHDDKPYEEYFRVEQISGQQGRMQDKIAGIRFRIFENGKDFYSIGDIAIDLPNGILTEDYAELYNVEMLSDRIKACMNSSSYTRDQIDKMRQGIIPWLSEVFPELKEVSDFSMLLQTFNEVAIVVWKDGQDINVILSEIEIGLERAKREEQQNILKLLKRIYTAKLKKQQVKDNEPELTRSQKILDYMNVAQIDPKVLLEAIDSSLPEGEKGFDARDILEYMKSIQGNLKDLLEAAVMAFSRTKELTDVQKWAIDKRVASMERSKLSGNESREF